MDFIIFTHYGPRLLSVVRLTRLLVADTAVILMSFCLSRGQRRRSVFRIGGTEERGPKGRGRGGILGEGQLLASPSPPARGSGERC